MGGGGGCVGRSVGGVSGEHRKAGADEGGLEAGEEVSFAYGNGVVCRVGEAGEGGGAGIDGVNVVPNGGRSHATKGCDDPCDEEAITGGGSGGVFGGLFGGAGGDDGVGIVYGGGEVGG